MAGAPSEAAAALRACLGWALVVGFAAAAYTAWIPLLLCSWLLRSAAAALMRLRASGTGRAEALSPDDAVWRHDTPSQPMVITAVLTFAASPLDLARLRRIISERVIGHEALGRFSCVLLPDRASATGYSWVRDEAFDIAAHVCAVPTADAPTTDAELQEWLGARASRPLPTGRPLWSLELIERLGEGSALVFRCHHVVGDGVVMSGVLLQVLMDPPSHAPCSAPVSTVEAGASAGASRGVNDAESRRSRRHVARASVASRLRAAARAAAELPHRLMSLMWRSDDVNACHGMWELSGRRRVAWSGPSDLRAVKAVARHHGEGASVNDVLLSAALGALGRYVGDQTAELAEEECATLTRRERDALRHVDEINIGIPFNARSAEETARVELRNRFAMLVLRAPLATPGGPRGRLARTVRDMREMKDGPMPCVMWTAMQAVQRALPVPLARWLVDAVADGTTAIVTNNRGPAEHIHLDGRRCEYWVSWAPGRATLGISLTVYSYAGEVRPPTASSWRSPWVAHLRSVCRREATGARRLRGARLGHVRPEIDRSPRACLAGSMLRERRLELREGSATTRRSVRCGAEGAGRLRR